MKNNHFYHPGGGGLKANKGLLFGLPVKGFTLAEALILLLITSLIIIATMPVITKRTRILTRYKSGPKGGWTCTRVQMPCTFHAPVNGRSFMFFYNNSEFPSFAATRIGTIKIVKDCTVGVKELYNNMDQYKKERLYLSGTFCTTANVVRILF